jgi:hypothetical protein
MLARKNKWLAITLAFFLVPIACPAGTIAQFGKPSVAPILHAVTPGVVNISTKKVEVVDSPVLRDPVMRELFDVPERALPAGNSSSRVRRHRRCDSRLCAH